MFSAGQPLQPQWRQFLELEEQIVRQPVTLDQCRLIEQSVSQLIGGTSRVWLARPYYPLPGEAEFDLLPAAPAPDLVQRVRLDGQPLCAVNFNDHEAVCGPDQPAFAAAIPLVANTNLLGVLQLERQPDRPLSEEDLISLEGLIYHAAAALEISRQEKLKNWRFEQLALVRKVSQQIANLLNLDQLCTRVTELIQHTFRYYYVAIFTLAPGQTSLQFRADASQNDAHHLNASFSASLNEGIIGTVAASGEQIVAPDTHIHPTFRYIDALPETLSEACFPLKVENQVLGVLDVQSDQLDAFNEIDCLVLNALADNIALAVQAARLYTDLEARAEQISSVIEVSHALNSILDYDQLLEEIVRLIQHRFNYQHVHIFSVHPGRRLVIYQAGTGERSQAMRSREVSYSLDSPQGIIAWVARNGQSFLSNNVNNEPLYLPAELPPYDTGAELTVPLRFGSEVIGVLDIQSSETNAFSENDRSLFEALASSIAIAYRNAGLYHSEKWRRQVAESFRDVATQISDNANLDQLLDSILSRLELNLPCDASAIWLVEEEVDIMTGERKHPLRLAAARKVDPDLLNQVMRGAPEVFTSLETLLEIPEPFIRSASDPIGPIGYALDFQKDYSSIAAPMRAGNRALGLLILAHHTSGRYGSEAQSMTATFASYAAVAIQNTRLYTEAQEQAWVSTMLVQVAEASQSTVSLDDLLATMLRLTRLLVGVKTCAFLLRLENQQYYELKAWYGFEPQGETSECCPITLPGLVRLESGGAPIFINDPAQEIGLAELALPGEDNALVLLPMFVRGEIIGAFLVGMRVNRVNTAEKGFDPKAVSILQGIAHQTSITVENLRLLEARQEEAYVTAALLQVAQAVVSANELAETLENIVHLLPILVGIEVCLIYDWEPAGHIFKATHAHSENRKQERFLLEQSFASGEHNLLDSVAGTGKVHLSPIIHSSIPAEEWPRLDSLPLEHGEDATSLPDCDWLLGFPLTLQGAVKGILVTREHSSSASVRERRLEIMNGIAQQISIAIQNDQFKRDMLNSERMEREIQLTRQIQEIFLPDQLPSSHGWEIDIRWETARQVGGDFYDAFMLDHEHIGLVIADVSDKGLPAALYMTVTRTLIRANISEHVSPASVLEEVNRLLFSESPEAMFITAVYAVLDTTTGELQYANAGHNHPLIYRNATGQVEQVPKGGTALGVLTDVELEEHILSLDSGDAIIMFTDGATDTLSPEGEDFGEDRLRQVIRANASLPVADLLRSLDQALDNFRSGTPLADDVTLLAVRRQ